MDSRPSYGPVSGLSLGRVLRKPWSHLAGQVVGEPGRSRSAFGIRDGASRTSSRPTGCVGTEPCSPIPAWRVLNEAEEPPRPRSGTVRCRRTTVPAVTARRCRCATRSWEGAGAVGVARAGSSKDATSPPCSRWCGNRCPRVIGTSSQYRLVSNLVQQLVEAGWSTAPATPRTGAARLDPRGSPHARASQGDQAASYHAAIARPAGGAR